MGTYTCLFGKVKFKEDVAQRARQYDMELVTWRPMLATRRLKKHPDITTFLSDQRVGMIANGGSSYFYTGQYPDQHHILGGIPDLTESYCCYQHNQRELTFFCSLKNYTDTIEKFLRILPLIADDWDLYFQTEDSCLYGHKPRRYRPAGFSLNVLLSQKDESGLHTPPVHDDPHFPMRIVFAEKGPDHGGFR